MILLHTDLYVVYVAKIESQPVGIIPVVPRKAVADVSEEEPYRRGWWL